MQKVPAKKKEREITHSTKRQKTPWVFIGGITLASFAIGVYFALVQNYLGSVLFILLPVMLVATLVKGSSRAQDENARPVSPGRRKKKKMSPPFRT